MAHEKRTSPADRSGAAALRLDQRLYAAWLVATGYAPTNICERYGIDRVALRNILREHRVEIGARKKAS